ncbi:MepB family protein [Flavobacterium caeni]|uniref:MepB protein n=1 Tax=Flavobacterium caeni TaxID=490189 RepID=A0A1G5I9L3_9FLAO|nr:MepB family protein [Flavobacterium caeni]SCY72350.1 hypothetical protein SAMN02927903_02163 [Flavobacterium caeni]
MTETKIPEILFKIKSQVFDKLGMRFGNLIENKESAAYSAYSFDIDAKKVLFRNAKITPKKIGQFVTVWKRNEIGVTQPYDVADQLDYIIINVAFEKRTAQFVFPKPVLLRQGIISSASTQGKRGLRVYPIWDKPNSKQAEKTQKWQLEYFIEISDEKTLDLALAKRIYLENQLHVGQQRR